jgi:hypothetical protein
MGETRVMAFTQAELDELERAIAGGELSVMYSDKRIQYRKLDDMLAIRDMMRKELGITPTQDRNIRLASGSKGT